MSTSAVVEGRIQQEATPIPMLGGFDDASYDDKGRLLLSTTQREVLKAGFTLGISEYGCLHIYPSANWKRLEEEIGNYSQYNPHKAKYHLLVFGRAASNMKLDAGERIQIPSHYRDKFKLPKKLKVVGNNDRYLIWTPEEFAEFDNDPLGFRQTESEKFHEIQNLLMQAEADIRAKAPRGGTA